MIWILFAALAHVANGLVFIVDKSLLGTKTVIGKPIQYALYSSLLAGFVIVLLPFTHIQLTSLLLVWSLIAGGVHIGALYVFFSAMRSGEPSRIVPITGSAVPLFTILFSFLFLGEVFTNRQIIGIILLLVGGWLLSVGRKKNSSSYTSLSYSLPIAAGILFAAYFAITKYIYGHTEGQFLGIFLVTRITEAMIAGFGVLLLLRPFVSWKKKIHHVSPKKIPFVFVSNKVLAAGAFLLQNYAISKGSVSIVNALQGIQYAFVFMAAILISRYVPRLFKEEVRKDILVQKVFGIILVSIGVVFLV